MCPKCGIVAVKDVDFLCPECQATEGDRAYDAWKDEQAGL